MLQRACKRAESGLKGQGRGRFAATENGIEKLGCAGNVQGKAATEFLGPVACPVENVRTIELYETETGRCHVQEFIEAISRRVDRAKIVKVFETIETTATVPSNFLKKLQGKHNLWEVRVRSFRFLGFYAGPGRLVLVHGFLKQSQKTPLHEIGVALTRQGAYLSRQR